MDKISEELTFVEASHTFKKCGIEFPVGEFDALRSGNPHIARILSDQCRHTVKIAVFSDDANTVFRDAKEFDGSVFRQFEESLFYLGLCNRTPFVFKGLERIEMPDYPREAIREALLNAIMHRDYGYSGSIIINVNDKRTEFISLGGLLPGLLSDDIRQGIFRPRNKTLADVFYRLGLIGSAGSGFGKIFGAYEGRPVQPAIEVTPNTFKLILPNLNSADGGRV